MDHAGQLPTLEPDAAGSPAGGGGRLLAHAPLAALLADAGIGLPRERLCVSGDDAAEFAEELGEPVAIKLSSPHVVHKSDVGGVRLRLADRAAVLEAAESLERVAADLGVPPGEWGLLVQAMVPPSEAEIFVGVKRDPVFGPVVVAGPGGRLVELLRATAVRRCPVSSARAREMIESTPLGVLLRGYRGAAAADIGAVAELIAAVSRLPDAHPEIAELDLNPVVAHPDHGLLAIDARAVIRDPSPAAPLVPAPAAAADLRPLLEARSVLVVGASERRYYQPPNRILRYLRAFGYPGEVFVVHPKASDIEGYTAYASVDDLPDRPIDLASITVGAAQCADVLARCGRRGIRAAIVHSSGFSEAGDPAAEERLAAIAREFGMLLCGPNSVGVISPGVQLHVSFTQAQNARHAPAGDVALVAQSGALGGAVLNEAWARGLGISRFISVGNQASLETADYLRQLAGDPRTRLACVLLEGVKDGAAFAAALEAMRDAGKPVVVLKLGRGAIGAEAVRSHTGSLAGDADVYRAVLHETGAIAVDSLGGMLDVAVLATSIRPPAGRRVAVLSTSGGACALLADLCERHALALPPLSTGVRDTLAAFLPAFASLGNPIDVTGEVASDPSLYGRAIGSVLGDDAVDAAVLMLTTIAEPQAAEIARAIVAEAGATEKPTVVSWTIAPELAPDGLAILRAAGIPVFREPESAIAALAAIAGPAR